MSSRASAPMDLDSSDDEIDFSQTLESTATKTDSCGSTPMDTDSSEEEIDTPETPESTAPPASIGEVKRKECSFEQLPQEIRFIIYELAIGCGHLLENWVEWNKPCRQIWVYAAGQPRIFHGCTKRYPHYLIQDLLMSSRTVLAELPGFLLAFYTWMLPSTHDLREWLTELGPVKCSKIEHLCVMKVKNPTLASMEDIYRLLSHSVHLQHFWLYGKDTKVLRRLLRPGHKEAARPYLENLAFAQRDAFAGINVVSFIALDQIPWETVNESLRGEFRQNYRRIFTRLTASIEKCKIEGQAS